jgi:hypothetical protein
VKKSGRISIKRRKRPHKIVLTTSIVRRIIAPIGAEFVCSNTDEGSAGNSAIISTFMSLLCEEALVWEAP